MYSSEAVLSDDVLDASDVDEALVLLALNAELLLVVSFFPHPLTLATPSVMSRSMATAFLFILFLHTAPFSGASRIFSITVRLSLKHLLFRCELQIPFYHI